MKIYVSLTGALILFFLNGCADKHIQTARSSPESEAVCWQLISDNSADPEELKALLDSEINRFQEQVEQLLVSAQESVRMIENITSQIDQNAPIPPAILETISLKMTQGLALVDPVAHALARNTCWQDANDSHLASLDLPPLKQQTRIKGILFELAATITLYDMYLNVVAITNESDRLRNFANKGDSGYGIEQNRIKEITKRFSDVKNIETVRKLIQKYDSFRSAIDRYSELDDNLAYLNLLIRSSRSYREFVKIPNSRLFAYKHLLRSNVIQDNLSEISSIVIGNISETFGNAVGRVEERKGKLYGDRELENHLAGNLQAGDVLLEKTPFRLTDRLIPGFWGHAAIWVGTETELRELAIWDHKRVRQYHKQLMNNQRVAEALREGTVLNTLSDFMNIDDLAVLRRNNVTQNEKRKVLIRAFRQLGKSYDFNFSVETNDRIVCSQLIYLAYPDIAWPTEYIAGRYTISPDNVAAKSLDNNLFEIVTLIRDGIIIKEDKYNVMASLIKTSE